MIFNASWFDSPVVLHSLLILKISQRLKILKDTKISNISFCFWHPLCHGFTVIKYDFILFQTSWKYFYPAPPPLQRRV